MKDKLTEKEKRYWDAAIKLYSMEKESVVLSFPKKLKRASDMFERDGKRWKAKSPQDMDLYIERKRPLDIMHKYWDTKQKKYITRCVGSFGDLSRNDKIKVYSSFCEYERDKKDKKINKFYLVDDDYSEHLKSDKVMKDWAGDDKLKKGIYKAWRYNNEDKMNYYEKQLSDREKKKGKNK